MQRGWKGNAVLRIEQTQQRNVGIPTDKTKDVLLGVCMVDIVLLQLMTFHSLEA